MIDSRRFPTWLLVTFFLAGCGEDETTPEQTTGQPQDDFTHLYACESRDFQVARRLSGAGYDPDEGLTGERLSSYIVHTTQIFTRPEQEQRFFELVGDVVVELEATPGLIGYSLAGDAACGDNRTLGVWESQDALLAFVVSEAHATAMEATPDLSLTGRTTHWSATAAEVDALDWEVAFAKLRDVAPFDGY
jgi:quinol monooxygenase YgiN